MRRCVSAIWRRLSPCVCVPYHQYNFVCLFDRVRPVSHVYLVFGICICICICICIWIACSSGHCAFAWSTSPTAGSTSRRRARRSCWTCRGTWGACTPPRPRVPGARRSQTACTRSSAAWRTWRPRACPRAATSLLGRRPRRRAAGRRRWRPAGAAAECPACHRSRRWAPKRVPRRRWGRWWGASRAARSRGTMRRASSRRVRARAARAHKFCLLAWLVLAWRSAHDNMACVVCCPFAPRCAPYSFPLFFPLIISPYSFPLFLSPAARCLLNVRLLFACLLASLAPHWPRGTRNGGAVQVMCAQYVRIAAASAAQYGAHNRVEFASVVSALVQARPLRCALAHAGVSGARALLLVVCAL